ncbi:MAG TPA: dihydrofolate reductase family protein [Herpetosiphonaceae bacterium]
MRKIIVTEFVSLDGVIDSPMWSMPYWNDEIAAFKGDEQTICDTLLLGRVTYEGFAAAWPGRSDPGADFMNNAPKYVVSNSLETADWNNSTIVGGDVPAEIAKLKQGDGKDILVYGSGKLIETLMEHDLVDSYRLLVYPVVVGAGRRLFGEGAKANLKLVESKALPKGVLALIYEPARD